MQPLRLRLLHHFHLRCPQFPPFAPHFQPPPLRCTAHQIPNKSQRSLRAFAASAAVKPVGDQGGGTDGFFADEDVSWKSLGVSDRVSQSLFSASIFKPSLVQAAAIPHILSGSDVVVAAETGSGKTHSYLVPLIDKLSAHPGEGADGGKDVRRMSLVLCPNVMLCEQVVHMANSLLGDSGEPLLRVAAVCGGQGWPSAQPDILVSTPAALLNCLFAFDRQMKRRSDFLRSVKSVVFDEADMLLCGSFQNQIIRIIHMLRFDEKLLSRMNSSGQQGSTGISEDSQLDIRLETEEMQQLEEDIEGENVEDEDGVENATETNPKKGWRRVREIYKRSKQYIFVAATLPGSGKKTAGGVLRRMFPDAIWVNGIYLHRHNPRLEQQWIEVTADTQVDALLNAVRCSRTSELGNSYVKANRTMVFTNTVDAAESVAKLLQRAAVNCLSYHSETPLDERAKNLATFREIGGVLVCTDAAARGLDVPNVSHVIQADFATSAVDFLHRIGRTARAGQSGTVTSLYAEANRNLVAAVRKASSMGAPVEEAFSRKRSFRNKLKKKERGRVDRARSYRVAA